METVRTAAPGSRPGDRMVEMRPLCERLGRRVLLHIAEGGKAFRCFVHVSGPAEAADVVRTCADCPQRDGALVVQDGPKVSSATA